MSIFVEGEGMAGTFAPPARWTVWAAHAVPLCVLPSGLWRVAMVAGYAGVDVAGMGVREKVYVLLLSVVSEGAALLTLGLVRPWGEAVPRWVPFAGGRAVPVNAAFVPAVTGAVAVAALCAYGVLNSAFHAVRVEPAVGGSGAGMPDGAALWFLTACYLPLLAWGPLVGVLAFAYRARRSGRVTGGAGVSRGARGGAGMAS